MGQQKEGALKTGIFSFLDFLFPKKRPGVSLIIPAYNEEKTISCVIEKAKNVSEIREIIVIDDGSQDKTSEIARKTGATVIRHHQNLGKGEALKTGIFHAKYSILLFLDADLSSLTERQIRALLLPIIRDKADFTKAAFNRIRGRVTEFAVKPMMKVLYPDSEFKQPISGQFAGRKSFLRGITIEPRWGIDISILLDAIKSGQRIVEVNIGELVHKKNSDTEVAQMSQEVLETMLKKAGHLCSKYKLIFFSDNTLFSKGFTQNSERFLEVLSKKKIKIVYLTRKEPKGFKGHKKYIDKIYELGHEKRKGKVLGVMKKIAKKHGASLDDCVLFTNAGYFKPITNKIWLSLCFTNSPEELKENCKVVHSLSDAFLFLE